MIREHPQKNVWMPVKNFLKDIQDQKRVNGITEVKLKSVAISVKKL